MNIQIQFQNLPSPLSKWATSELTADSEILFSIDPADGKLAVCYHDLSLYAFARNLILTPLLPNVNNNQLITQVVNELISLCSDNDIPVIGISGDGGKDVVKAMENCSDPSIFRKCCEGLLLHLCQLLRSNNPIQHNETSYQITASSIQKLDPIANLGGFSRLENFKDISDALDTISSDPNILGSSDSTKLFDELKWFQSNLDLSNVVNGDDLRRLEEIVKLLGTWSDASDIFKDLKDSINFFVDLAATKTIRFCYFTMYQNEILNKRYKKKIPAMKSDNHCCLEIPFNYKLIIKRCNLQCSCPDKRRCRHRANKSFTCHICKKIEIGERSFDAHLNHHRNSERTPCKFPITCPHCNQKLANQDNLSKHIRNKHSTIKKFKCDTCDFTSFLKNVFADHKLKHESDKFSCPDCKNTFRSKASLCGHIRYYCGAERVICPSCQKPYANERNLILHRRRGRCKKVGRE